MSDDRLVKLEWRGPFTPNQIPGGRGVYAVCGGHHVYGQRVLIYIGMAEDFPSRIVEHGEWLTRMANNQGCEIYAATIENPEVVQDVERLLIFAHVPSYNSSGLNELNLSTPLRIWNTGNFPAGVLLPVLDSEYPWFGKSWR